MAALLDICRFNPTLGGTTDWTYASTITGYQSPTAAGVDDTLVYRYRAESSNLTQWEIGYGAYTASTGVFARTTVLFNSLGTTAKIDFTVAPQVAIVLLAEDVREKLDAARTYYVRTDGSDSNTGLVNTAAGGFLTIQKAIDVANTLDFGGFVVTVQIADGTYSLSGANNTLKPNVGQAGPASFIIQGNSSTPANVVVSVTNGQGFYLDGPETSAYIKNLKITTITTGSLFYVANKATLFWSNINCGACASYQIVGFGNSLISFQGSGGYAISGAGICHVQTFTGSVALMESVGTVTITGTPAFSSRFASVDQNAGIRINGNTYSGAATGQRYSATGNGTIFVNGAGATYLPGDTAGATSTGGQYY